MLKTVIYFVYCSYLSFLWYTNLTTYTYTTQITNNSIQDAITVLICLHNISQITLRRSFRRKSLNYQRSISFLEIWFMKPKMLETVKMFLGVIMLHRHWKFLKRRICSFWIQASAQYLSQNQSTMKYSVEWQLDMSHVIPTLTISKMIVLIRQELL